VAARPLYGTLGVLPRTTTPPICIHLQAQHSFHSLQKGVKHCSPPALLGIRARKTGNRFALGFASYCQGVLTSTNVCPSPHCRRGREESVARRSSRSQPPLGRTTQHHLRRLPAVCCRRGEKRRTVEENNRRDATGDISRSGHRSLCVGLRSYRSHRSVGGCSPSSDRSFFRRKMSAHR